MGTIQVDTIVNMWAAERLGYSWGEWNAEVLRQRVQWEAEEVSSVRCSQDDKIIESVSARTGKGTLCGIIAEFRAGEIAIKGCQNPGLAALYFLCIAHVCTLQSTWKPCPPEEQGAILNTY